MAVDVGVDVGVGMVVVVALEIFGFFALSCVGFVSRDRFRRSDDDDSGVDNGRFSASAFSATLGELGVTTALLLLF